MKGLILAGALCCFLLAMEFAIPAWRNHVPLSTAAVFSLPMANDAMQNPGTFQRSIDVYRADRGAELKLPGPDGTSLTVFYFEWDQVEAGPMMRISGHRPEECNIAAGFTLLSQNPKRSFKPPGQSPLVFDTTTFSDPMGRKVHVYKTAWLQGFGSREIREGENRHLRLQNSFERGTGASRVIECGVTAAQDETHAWQIFQKHVLHQIVWSSRMGERPASP